MEPAAWVGRSIDGRYVVESVLGIGGMGTVLRAKHQFTGVPVAIKVLRHELAADAEVQARFLAEAQAPNAIGHPAIVKVLDAGRTSDGVLYMAMELLVGRALRAAVTRRDLSTDQIKRVMHELLTVLGHAHARGFIHRDLKPDNVFLCTPNDEVKLLDFGIAKVLDDARRRTQAGALLGTPAYMAPEQLADASNVDSRADLWAIGVMLYELVTGRLPLAGTTPNELMLAVAAGQVTPIRTVMPSVSIAVEQFFERALARDPRRRFGAAIELAVALSALELSGAPRAPQIVGAPGVSGTVATAPSGAEAGQRMAPVAAPPFAGVPATVASWAPGAASPVVGPADVAPPPAPAPPPAAEPRSPRRSSTGLILGGSIAVVAIVLGLVLAFSGGSKQVVAVVADAAARPPDLDRPKQDPEPPPDPPKHPPEPTRTDPTPSRTQPKPTPGKPAQPEPAKPEPAQPESAKPEPAPEPAKPEPAVAAAPDRATCEARCAKARECGTHLNTCVADCLARPDMADCLRRGETSCAEGALCGARLLCGGRVPQGSQSCGQVVACQLGCATSFGGPNNPQAFSCGCDCTTQLHPSQILTLARINSCVFRCNFDPTCINSACGGPSAACQ